MNRGTTIEIDQTLRYDRFYERFRKLRRLFRFDIRYRCRRLHDLFAKFGLSTENKRVLDVGFGGGDLLASFPESCALTGVDISSSAVRRALEDEMFARFRRASFTVVNEENSEDLPNEEFDVILSSHMLEHVPDDDAVLRAIRGRLGRDGVMALFVPIEEPDYISFHRRNYSLQSISEKVRQAGFELLFTEGSMYVNGHLWKLITVPSRRGWPVIGPLVDAFRLTALSSLPYSLLRVFDIVLYRLGFDARQALVLARPRAESNRECSMGR